MKLQLFVFIALGAGSLTADTVPTPLPWSLRDSVEAKYFNLFSADTKKRMLAPAPGWASVPHDFLSPILPSPDGKHFATLTLSGDLAADERIATLKVYATKTVTDALAHGGRLQTVASEVLRSQRSDLWTEPIASVQWRDDWTLLFLGAAGKGPFRVYRLVIGDSKAVALTPDSLSVISEPWIATFQTKGNSLMFPVAVPRARLPREKYPIVAVQGEELLANAPQGTRVEWYGMYRSAGPVPLVQGIDGTLMLGPWFSPDGRFAVAVYAPEVGEMPAVWSEYETKPDKGYRFFLLDFEHGSSRPLIDAPAGGVTPAGRGRHVPFGAFWTADGSHVLLFNTALPLDRQFPERRAMSYLIDVDLRTRSWRTVAPLVDENGFKLMEISRVRPGLDQLILTYRRAGTSDQQRTLAWTEGSWNWLQASTPATPEATPRQPWPEGLEIRVRQGPDEPPSLVASQSGREIEIEGKDPAIANTIRVVGEPLSWTDEDRGTVSARLFLPPHPRDGERPPLVVQGTDGDDGGIFSPDGGPNLYAAQALANAGFAVLQLPFAYDDHGKTMQTPREGPARVARLDRAVAELKSHGLVDPNRVGLMGFSRAGYSTYYVITHPGRTAIRAAAIFDGVSCSYGEYVFDAATGDLGSQIYEDQYGKGTFWQNKSGWMDAPGFNLDRCRSPTLWETPGEGISNAFELLGGFRLNHLPLEYLRLPSGMHVLQRPREHEAAMQAYVDWMCFWLLGEERNTAAKGDRYVRWRALKAEWQKTLQAADDHSGAEAKAP